MAAKGSPAHGIGDDAVDFDALYAWLDSQVVSLPTIDEGDPISPREVGTYFLRVQKARENMDRAYVLLERKLGSVERTLVVAKERVRLARAEVETDPKLLNLSRAELAAAATRKAMPFERAYAAAKSRRAQLEAAHRAVKTHIETMETAKQTLNALRNMAEDEVSFNGREQRRRSH